MSDLLHVHAAAPDYGYEIRSWTTDEGLPHNAATRAIQDSTGFLWFGTVGGLARFDGREFRNIPISAEHPEHAHNIRGLAEESPGTLLVLASPGKLVRIMNGEVAPHPANAHLGRLRDTPVDLFVESSGAVWVATTGGSLMRWNGAHEAPDVFGIDAPVAARSKRFSFATDSAGTTWIASDEFLAAFHDGRLHEHPNTPAGPLLLAASRDGKIWVCTNDRLFLMHDGELQLQSAEVPWKDDFDSVRHLHESQDGALLITGRREILRFHAGRFESVGLRYPLITYILEDNEQNLWLSTSGSGIGQLRERSHRFYSEDSGLRQDGVSAIAEDAKGRIWIANRNGGLHVLDPETGVAAPFEPAAAHRPVEVVAVDPKGTVWFGGADIGLWRLGASATTVTQLPAPSHGVNALLTTRSGDLWFPATGGRIVRFRDGSVREFDEKDGYVLGSAYAMLEDRDHSIWIGGRNGTLLRWDETRFQQVAKTPGDAAIHDLALDADGLLWVGTSNGLLIRDPERIHHLTTQHGLPDNVVYNVLDDRGGQIWLATRRGLFHAPRAELLAVARGASLRLLIQRFGPEQGLRGFTPTPNFDPNALRTRDGRLLFATTQGVLEIDPPRVSGSSPPPVLVDGIRWNGDALPVPASRTIHLPSGSHRVDFELVVLNYTASESILLQHRLVGFDANWTETGSDRVATYTNLAPGNYQLLVAARNAAGVWSESMPLLNLVVQPAWWETTSFRLLAVLATAFTIAAVARAVSQRRLRARLRKLEEAHALQRERARIARDLHDELGASITEVGLVADRLVESAPRELASQLSGLAWRTRRIATDLSGIVWTMNSSHSSLDQLAAFLRRYSERLFRHSGVRCLVEGVETVPSVPVSPDIQHHLLASTKEALNNIVKHAQATDACVRLSYRDGTFEVEVRDNGIGYPIEHANESEGNGLRNMRTRMQEVGGNCRFTSSEGQGTVVTLRVPLAAAAARI